MAHKPYRVHVLHPGYARTYCGQGENAVHKKVTKEYYNRFFAMTGQVLKHLCQSCVRGMEAQS